MLKCLNVTVVILVIVLAISFKTTEGSVLITYLYRDYPTCDYGSCVYDNRYFDPENSVATQWEECCRTTYNRHCYEKFVVLEECKGQKAEQLHKLLNNSLAKSCTGFEYGTDICLGWYLTKSQSRNEFKLIWTTVAVCFGLAVILYCIYLPLKEYFLNKIKKAASSPGITRRRLIKLRRLLPTALQRNPVPAEAYEPNPEDEQAKCEKPKCAQVSVV